MIDNSKLILTDTLYFWYPIFLISDISDTQYFWYPIYFRYIWYGTWYFWYPYFWYPIFIIPDINDTQYIWYFWYMNLFLIPNRGHYYAACAIFIAYLGFIEHEMDFDINLFFCHTKVFWHLEKFRIQPYISSINPMQNVWKTNISKCQTYPP